jgi:peptidoglycan/LPS O-acetylase OafA/YrhL
MTAMAETLPMSVDSDSQNGRRSAASEIPALDGVRGLAMLLVLWDHLTLASLTYGATSALPLALVIVGEYGDWGLHLFFILSGFLLFLPYARTLIGNSEHWPSPRQFYTRRARRILPLYFVAVAMPALVALDAAVSGQGMHYLLTVAAIMLLFHNMQADAWQMIYKWDGALWSLAVEWQFYLVLPWIALGMRRIVRPLRADGRGRMLAVLALLGALAVVGLGIRGIAAYLHYGRGLDDVTGAPHGVGFVFLVLYGLDGGKFIETFAIGMATAVLYVIAVERGGLSIRVRAPAGWLAAAAGGIGLALVAFWWHRSHGLPFPADARIGGWPDSAGDWPWAVFGAWAMGLCCCAVTFGAPLIRGGPGRFWTARVMRYVGKISYSGYVWHVIVLWHLVPLGFAFGRWATPWLFATTVALVIVVASASYWLVERPFLPAPRRRLAHLTCKPATLR